MRRLIRMVAPAVAGAMAMVALGGAALGSDVGACLRAPTAAPVIDPFRPPECPWCPGNRGIEFATALGDPLTAMADGVVSFAGVVAGVRYVTVIHSGARPGLRSTFSGVAEVFVAVGEEVIAGQVIALAGGPTLVTVRVAVPPDSGAGSGDGSGAGSGAGSGDGWGMVYIDPAPLLARPTWQPRLVPADGTPARPPHAAAPTCGVPTASSG